MRTSIIDEHVARRKLVLKDVNTCLSFFTTLYKGEVIMLAFNNLNRSIMNFWCNQNLDNEDVELLEKILCDYYKKA